MTIIERNAMHPEPELALDPFTGPSIRTRAPKRIAFIYWDGGMPPFLRDDAGGSDGGGDGGGGGGDDKKHTDADVEKIVKARMSSLEKKYSGFDEMKTKIEGFSEVQEELAKLKAAKDDDGKSDVEKELNQVRRELESMAKERDDATTLATQAVEAKLTAEVGLKSYVVAQQVGSGLLEAGVLPKAAKQATALLVAESAAEMVDKDGTPALQMTVDKRMFTDPKEAAAHWLKDNAHFAKANVEGGGGGTHRSTGSGGKPPADLDKMGTGSLLKTGLSQPSPNSK